MIDVPYRKEKKRSVLNMSVYMRTEVAGKTTKIANSDHRSMMYLTLGTALYIPQQLIPR